MLLEEIKNIKSSKDDLRKFGRTIGIVLVLISAALFYYRNGLYFPFAVTGLLIWSAGLFLPIVLLPLQKVWMGIAVILGFIMTRVILSILFYFVVTPIGLVARLFKKDFLNLKLNRNSETYWHYREKKPYDKVDTERQF